MEDSASEQNMEVCDNTLNTASTSSKHNKEDCGNNTASTSTNREEDSAKNTASTSEQNMEEAGGNNTASTSEQNMEEDGGNSTASTSEQNMDLGTGSDLERCSNCKAELNHNDKVRISTLIDAKTTKILFPHLPASDFLCVECVKMVKSKTKFNGFNKRRTWAGSGSSSVDSTPPPPKQDKTKGTVGGGGDGVPSLSPAPTSTQNAEGSIRCAVVPKRILSVALSKQNEGSVNIIQPCRPNMDRVTVVGPSASKQNTGSAMKPQKQNMGASVTAPSTTKPNMEGTVKVPPTFKPNTKGSVKYIVVPRLPTVLPTNWNVKKPANNSNMPSTSEQSTGGSGSESVRRCCSLCKKEFQYDVHHKSLDRIRISTLVDLKTAKVLFPHLSPEEFICRDPCEKWVKSKTKQRDSKKYKRTWTGFCMDHDSTNTNSDAPYPAPTNDMPSTSEQSTEGSVPSTSSAEGSGSGSVLRCSLCKKELKYDVHHKSLGRIRISTLVDRRTAQVLLPHLSLKDFICRDPCAAWVHSKTKPGRTRTSKKRTWTGFSMTKYPLPLKKMKMDHDSTKTNPVSTPDGPSPAPKKVGKVTQAIGALRCGKYIQAFRKLLELPSATKAFNKVCQEIIRKECVKLTREATGPFRKQVTPENVSSFTWKEANAWIEEKAPLTFKCLQSMFPQAQKLTGQTMAQNVKEEPRRPMTEEEAQQLVDKRIGIAMSIALYTGSIRNTFVPYVIGVEMFREGCSQKMFKIMNSLGLSQLKLSTAMHHVARLQDDHDKEVKLWKGQVEKRNNRSSRVPSYSLTWDRVKIRSDAKHELLGASSNKPRIWAFRFAHRNRIPFIHLRGPPQKALDVPPDSILPSKQTYEALRQRMKTIVMRIIVDNLTSLEGLRSKVVWHIPHLYSKQMKEKSNVINLGAVPVDLKGDTEIMEDLIEYVPTLSPGKPLKILCCSDGLNLDTTEDEPMEPPPRFEGLVDAPPEYHKASLCYQDIMKMLFSQKSVEARGSLSELKSVFAVRGHSIEGQHKETVQHVLDLDFITFVTSAYITLYAATECNLDTVDQKPSDFPTDTAAQMEWLSGLSHRLVDLVWMPPPQEDIDTAAAAASLSELKKKDSCFCGEEKPGETLVQCCSNLCAGVWFHEGCAPVGTTDPTVTQDWFCSPECQGDGTYIYCYCKEQRGGQMVQCGLMDQCRRHEWYHKDCLSLSEQANADSEESLWYCSEMCFIASDEDDHVLNYTKALVWEGLYNMARRDAVKEGDGEAMTDFWKMDMVLFWDRKRLQDFTICHRLLTGIEGFYPEHIRQDLKWNRVANLEGKPGCNIGLDLVNEFMNIELKESLKRLIDDHQYSTERLELCGKMAGALGYEPNRILIALGAGNSSGLATSLAPTHIHRLRRQADIAEFVAEYKKDHLFRYIPGRAHQGFEKFTYQKKIQTPKKMGKTMRTLAQEMDIQS